MAKEDFNNYAVDIDSELIFDDYDTIAENQKELEYISDTDILFE